MLETLSKFENMHDIKFQIDTIIYVQYIFENADKNIKVPLKISAETGCCWIRDTETDKYALIYLVILLREGWLLCIETDHIKTIHSYKHNISSYDLTI